MTVCEHTLNDSEALLNEAQAAGLLGVSIRAMQA